MDFKNRFLIMLTVFFLIFSTSGNLLAKGKILLTDSDSQTILAIPGNNKVFIGKRAYTYKSWGINRLRLKQKNTDQGVFLKRLGVRLVIRDLQGNILHIIQKEGFVFQVKTPTGEYLIFIKISHGKVVVFREKGQTLFTITSKNKTALIKDNNGHILYTLKGETGIFPASFLCIPDLSWEERAACYLLYRGIPFPYK